MPRLISIAALMTALLAQSGVVAAATMYRWVDAQGVVHYSDTPQPGAERVALPNAQTYRATPVPAASTDAAPKAADAPVYQSCAITEPLADATLYAPEAVTISVGTSPQLRPGDQLSVTLDGATLQAAGNALSFQADAPERGTHTLNATVRDASGKIVCSSPGLSFNVQRPSLLSPQSPAKGH
jgi:hypothetical protein